MQKSGEKADRAGKRGDRTGQDKKGQDKPGEDSRGQGRTGKNRTGRHGTRPDRTTVHFLGLAKW